MNRLIGWGLVFFAFVGAGIGAYARRDLWLERVRGGVGKLGAKPEAKSNGPAQDDHDGHHHGPSEAVTLSEQAAKNLGLQTAEVQPSDYWKTISVPASVAEQPNRSERRLTALVPGIVLRIHAVPGQTIRSGESIADLQVTGEGIVTAQANLLRTIQEIELIDAELKRLAPVVESGVIAEKSKVDKEYERRRLEASQKVQIQELLVRGLTSEQIQRIAHTRELLREVSIVAPHRLSVAKASSLAGGSDAAVVTVSDAKTTALDHRSPDADEIFTVERIDIFPGKFVQPGDALCDLALHATLLLEGTAFESEASVVAKAIERKWPVTASFDPDQGKPAIREGLRILYMDNVVDPATRTLKFTVPLANEVVRDDVGPDGHTYRIWRFRPGQKLRLLIPVEKWTERFVVPAEAVVREGPDAYAFRVNGKQMERVAVHLERIDDHKAVIANDGSLFPGDAIALNSAYQLNLALKKAAGSGADPHAGHDHAH